jgi:arylamine N-acetyltransferase
MRPRFPCPSLHRCICFLLLPRPLIKIPTALKPRSPNKEEKEWPNANSSLKDHRLLQTGYRFDPQKKDDPDDRFHRPWAMYHLSGTWCTVSECLSELGRAKRTRTQCRSITERERERERRRNGREVSGHIDEEVVEILARFVTCF